MSAVDSISNCEACTSKGSCTMIWWPNNILALIWTTFLIRGHFEKFIPVYDYFRKWSLADSDIETQSEIQEFITLVLTCALLTDRTLSPSSLPIITLRQEFGWKHCQRRGISHQQHPTRRRVDEVGSGWCGQLLITLRSWCYVMFVMSKIVSNES
jgi:hypothetical protein